MGVIPLYRKNQNKIMTRNKIYWDEIGVSAELSLFNPSGMTEEIHAIFHVKANDEEFASQLSRLNLGQKQFESKMPGFKAVFKRYFLSDSTNQRPLMEEEPGCSVSYIQQPPLDGSRIALWGYYVKGADVTNEDGMTIVSHNGYRHLWKMGMQEHQGDSESQTRSLLCRYESDLAHHGATLSENCIRTWFFVRDVDSQYAGMVKARRENFEEQGLTSQTHYIASTGIGGSPSDTRALVQLGAYSMTGFEPSQQRYLYAPTHLNPTYEYGVTFERGTSIEYGDRRHVLISGTASINNKGEVMHVGDISKQMDRMCENVGKLLEEGCASYSDVMQIVVYLRDLADYNIVKRMFDSRFPDIPYVITLAPVCRPTWLIEMECIAVVANKNENYRNF